MRLRSASLINAVFQADPSVVLLVQPDPNWPSFSLGASPLPAGWCGNESPGLVRQRERLDCWREEWRTASHVGDGKCLNTFDETCWVITMKSNRQRGSTETETRLTTLLTALPMTLRWPPGLLLACEWSTRAVVSAILQLKKLSGE